MVHPIDPETLLYAYCQGIFPMADSGTGEVGWYRPDPRAVIPLEAVHVPRKLARLVRKGTFEIRCDTAFEAVMRGCASPRFFGDETWISDSLVDVYSELNTAGFAHSIEAWRDGRLVGGLYGVHVGGLFAGESMFIDAEKGGTNSSKVCFVHLVAWLVHRGFLLLDAQMKTPHTARFGCVEISAQAYDEELKRAISSKVPWGEFKPLQWPPV